MKNNNLPPGTMGLPIIGETLQLIFEKNFLERRYKQHGSIFKTHIFGKPYVFMIGSEAAEFVLASHADCFTWQGGWNQPFEFLFDKSLLVQDGKEHNRNRKLMMPALHGTALISYFKTIENLTKTYIKTWEKEGKVFLHKEFKKLTFNIGSQVFLGVDTKEDTENYSNLFTTLAKGWSWFKFPNALVARKQILNFINQVTQQRQLNPTTDVLSLLLQSTDENGDHLSTEEICVQAMTVLFAGHETTTIMLCWVCLELFWRQDILARAREEQYKLAEQGELSMAQLNQMPYLDQILQEVERLRPPVPLGFRRVNKSFEFNGYYVPAGWKLQYSIFLTHQSEQIYTEPERFDPDRFSMERQESKKKPYSLIGFGGGSRICIGIAFAKLEMKIIMSYLLRNYTWEISPVKRTLGHQQFLDKWYIKLHQLSTD